VAALIAEQALPDLRAPVARLAPRPIPTPFARELEARLVLDKDRIAEAIHGLAGSGVKAAPFIEQHRPPCAFMGPSFAGPPPLSA
jgi:hypothetical protein